MLGAKRGADALVGGVVNSVGNAYDNVRDAIADGIVGKEDKRVGFGNRINNSMVSKTSQTKLRTLSDTAQMSLMRSRSSLW